MTHKNSLTFNWCYLVKTEKHEFDKATITLGLSESW